MTGEIKFGLVTVLDVSSTIPEQALSPLKGLDQAVRLPLNFKDLYRFIRRASRQPAAIVIQTSIVL